MASFTTRRPAIILLLPEHRAVTQVLLEARPPVPIGFIASQAVVLVQVDRYALIYDPGVILLAAHPNHCIKTPAAVEDRFMQVVGIRD